jgi:hypothetical protein
VLDRAVDAGVAVSDDVLACRELVGFDVTVTRP